MIEYINKRMIDWATWCKRREDGGLGYPSSANFCQMVQADGGLMSGIVVEDAAAMEIEEIVLRLKCDRAQLYDVAYWIYLAGNFTMDRVARELGCCRDTVYARLHLLHVRVMDEMHENSIRAEENKKKYLR